MRVAASLLAPLVWLVSSCAHSGPPLATLERSDASSMIEIPGDTPLWLAPHETTQAEFARFVEATGYETTAEREGGAKVWRDDRWVMDPRASWRTVFPGAARPVVALSWDDAAAYCAWLNEVETPPPGRVYRLPSDAEWLRGARAGGAHELYAGTDTTTQLCDYANVPDRSAAREGLGREVFDCEDGVGLGTAEVGRYRANAWGLHDMSGNVWEWTRTPGPEDPATRLMRGGSWSGKLVGPRLDHRDAYPTSLRGGAIGFRVALGQP